jgi:hypothetical protein
MRYHTFTYQWKIDHNPIRVAIWRGVSKQMSMYYRIRCHDRIFEKCCNNDIRTNRTCVNYKTKDCHKKNASAQTPWSIFSDIGSEFTVYWINQSRDFLFNWSVNHATPISGGAVSLVFQQPSQIPISHSMSQWNDVYWAFGCNLLTCTMKPVYLLLVNASVPVRSISTPAYTHFETKYIYCI